MSLRGLFPLLLIVPCLVLFVGCSDGAAARHDQSTPSLSSQIVPSETPIPTLSPTLDSSPTSTDTPTPTITFTPEYSATPLPTSTPDTRPKPRDWSSWPVIPSVTARVKEIYLEGLRLGVTPRSFSVIGDCQSNPNFFLGIYGTDRYSLGAKFEYLQATIDDFKPSFSHESITVRDGLSAPSVLDPNWSDPKQCGPTESPVQCEMRLSKPMIVFISLGTNWRPGASAERYEEYLRQIVDIVIADGAIPILFNKADNIEGDHSVNLVTAQVAYDYDLPLINFWLAADNLPNHGLDPDRQNIYLTIPALDMRSFLALQTLDKVWRELKAVPTPSG